ncbi:MAG: transitional endoplasmic reticulum ATPase [Thermoproteota archaeon]|nr:transitional endoplasmic reticulum ATPase [Thermoproteota archaeon]
MSDYKNVRLRIVEARSRDVGRGIVRVGSRAQKVLGLTPGDVLAIEGKRTTVATFWPGYPDDEGMEIIRVDGITRHNLGVSIEELVYVRKAEIKVASRITLAPPMAIRFSEDFEEYVKRQLLGRPISRGDTVTISVLGEALQMQITSTVPSPNVVVGEGTKVTVSTEPGGEVAAPEVTYEDIGGLKNELQRIRETIELPLKHPELFKHVGIEPPKGVLLYGPPGTGKTLIAKAVANEAGAHFTSINGPEIMSKYYGESEERLRQIFKEAEENAPSIIFIDEIDTLAPKREEVTGEVEKRIVSQLLTVMDGLKGRGRVIVIGATNRVDAVDPALRRPGRFDREIAIGVPDKEGREEIIRIHARHMPLDSDVNLTELAELTHGFVGADLAALCREAAMNALRRYLPQVDLEKETIPTEILEKIKVTSNDFSDALKTTQPSAMREVYVEVPDVHWSDVGDLETVKQQLKEAVEWPIKSPEIFTRLGVRPVKGILLYGPPGTGKTLLVKAVANESEANFISVRGPEVLSKWVGESEKAVREIFQKARQTSPCIIFFDELDSIVPQRGSRMGDSGVTERIVNQLLTEMDGLVILKNVVVVGATNRADLIDAALLRPGRFDRVIYVPPPNKIGRLEIFKIHAKAMPLAKDVDLTKLSDMTEGYTGADIEAVCREAAMIAARENKEAKEVKAIHFEAALKAVSPSLTKEGMARYEKTAEDLKRMIS